jgi:hypothetical protein
MYAYTDELRDTRIEKNKEIDELIKQVQSQKNEIAHLKDKNKVSE